MNENLDFNGYIEDDGQYSSNEYNFSALPPGNYDFEVISHEKTFSKNNNPMVNLVLRLTDGNNEGYARTQLTLVKSAEWKLSQFFRSIGLKKHGERIQMNWDKVDGAKGRLKNKNRTFKGRDGDEVAVNDIDRFYDPQPAAENKKVPWSN